MLRKLSFLLGFAVVAALTLLPNTGAAADQGFVKTSGAGLTLAGQPYTFVGVNRYNLITVDPPGPAYQGCGGTWSAAELASWFMEIRDQGVNAVRFWAFQKFTASGVDFSRLDLVISLAAQNGIKVIPVLENQWQDCTSGGYKYDTWYSSGYKAPYGSYPLSLKDYAALIVARYKDDDRILMWQLMNEAETKTTSGQCGSASAFKSFAANVSAFVKSIDPNHLVSLGTMGGGQCGAQGAQYQSLHDVASIDLCEFHDYNSSSVPMPGDQWNGLQVRLTQCAALGKALFVGEAGIKSGCSVQDCYSAAQRALYFDAKMSALYKAGGVGYMIWSYRDRAGASPPWEYDAEDPLAQVTKKYGTCAWDLNGDLIVNGADVLTFNPYFGTRTGEPGYDPRWDLNHNGLINGADILALNPYFGMTCVPQALW